MILFFLVINLDERRLDEPRLTLKLLLAVSGSARPTEGVCWDAVLRLGSEEDGT